MVLASGVSASGFDDAMLAFENRDFDRALAIIEPVARSGSPAAVTLLGRIWDEGYHDPARALPYYRQAAEKGYADAQVQLAELYDAGDGVPRDMDAAIRWYEKAAKQGHEEAQVALGLHYSEDLNDNLSALDYFLQAADQGNATAQYRLGLIYLGDPSIPRDDIKSWLYFSLAAERMPESDEARSALELNMTPELISKARQALAGWLSAH